MIPPSYRCFLILKRLFFLFIQCTSYRRAMVNKLWCQEVTRKWFYTKEEPPHPRLLTEPKCQRRVNTWYLVYRWLILMAWASITVCAIFGFGGYKTVVAYDKWLIYLTNWQLLLGTIQALLGGFLVSKRWKKQKLPDFDPSTLVLGFIERIYWSLYVVTSTVALGVTITYWSAIFNPKIHYVDSLNIMQHIVNSILIIIDFCITSVPFRFRNCWWCLVIVALYSTFSLVYYLAGGVNKNGHHYIYKILDWKKPGQSILMCLGEAILLIALFAIICFLEKMKDRLYINIDKKLGRLRAESQISGPEKRVNIV